MNRQWTMIIVEAKYNHDNSAVNTLIGVITLSVIRFVYCLVQIYRIYHILLNYNLLCLQGLIDVGTQHQTE